MSGGYEPIPDVEAGIQPQPEDLTAKAKAKYPEANDMEAEFLGKLDYAIDNAKPRVTLPKIKPEDIAGGEEESTASSIMEFLASLKLPTAALATCLAAAAVVVVCAIPALRALYPYFTCVLTFLSGVPATKDVLMSKIAGAFRKVDDTQRQIDDQVDGVTGKALKFLNDAEGAMNAAIAPIKDKAAMATKAEKMLQLIKPDIDIPDTTDIEKSFDGFEDTIKGATKTLDKAVDVTKSMPVAVRSTSNFEKFVVYPYLGVFLMLALLGTYASTQSANDDEEENIDVIDDVASNVTRYLQSAFDSAIEDLQDLEVPDALTNSTSDQSFAEEAKAEWDITWYAVQSYFTTVVQLAVAFLVSQARMIAAQINLVVGKVEGDVNKYLDKSLGPMFDKVFVQGFGAIRDQMLDLIRKVEIIEGPLKQVQAKMGGLSDKVAGLQDLGKQVGIDVPDVKDLSKSLTKKVPKVGNIGKKAMGGFGGFKGF